MKAGAGVWLAGCWLCLAVSTSLLAPLLSMHGPELPVGPALSPSAPGLPLGADALGRDFLARLLYGGRLSLWASVLASALSLIGGGVAGLAAGALGGLIERLVLWSANAALAIPGLLLAMLLVAAMGPGLPTVVLAVGLGGTPGIARITRSIFLQLRQSSYVSAAEALGAGQRWIAIRHLLPNARPHLLTLATTNYAWAFMGITTLTFLGLAGDPSVPEWGAMLNDGRSHLFDAPHLALWPGLAIGLTILAVHALGPWQARVRPGD
jgi:ABC-type dipeptide/oligopeptide/nickel transport system permease subunit